MHNTRYLVFRCFLLSMVTLLTIPWQSRGGPLDWFGDNAGSAAMGGTGMALGRDGGSLLLNPAMMSWGSKGVWLSFSAAPNWMRIKTMKRPDGYDVPESIYQSRPEGWGEDRGVPTSMLTNERGSTDNLDPSYMLSLAAIGSAFHDSLRFGLGFTAPLPSLVSIETWYNDEREQHFSNKLHFERFGEFDAAMSFYPGMSFAPVDWFSIGFTLQVDLMLAMKAKLFLTEATEWEYSYLNTAGEVKPVIRPIAGLGFRTPVGLGFGLTYKHEAYLEVGVDVDLRVWNGELLDDETGEYQLQFQQSHRTVLGYRPRELGVAASYENGPFSAEVSGTFEMWSDYLDRHGNHWTHPTTELSREDGWDDDWKDPSFDNVFSFNAGAQYDVSKWAALRAGFAYYPSPMPDQTGRYNYVDNDLLMYSLGAGFRFAIANVPVTADLAAQLWQMRSMTVNKSSSRASNQGGLIDEVSETVTDFNGDPIVGSEGLQTNNPGFPGYEFGGMALNVALTLGVQFN